MVVFRKFIILVLINLFSSVLTKETNVNCSFLSLYPFPNDCAKFTQFGSEGATTMHCPKGLHFNPNLNICDWPHQAGCLQQSRKQRYLNSLFLSNLKIKENPPAFRADPTDCATYITIGPCGELKMKCPFGLKFNPKYNICDWANNVNNCFNMEGEEISLPDTLEGVELISEEGPIGSEEDSDMEMPSYLLGLACIGRGIFPHQSICRKFVICAPYETFHIECPAGTNFNPVTKICDENYECLQFFDINTNIDIDKDRETSNTMEKTLDPKNESDKNVEARFFHPFALSGLQNGPLKLPQRLSQYKPASTMAYKIFHPNLCQTNGNFPHPRSCRKFVMCTEKQALVISCPLGLHYNPQDQLCDLPFYAKCSQKLYVFMHPFAELNELNRPLGSQGSVHPLNPINLNTYQPDFASTTENPKNPNKPTGYLPVTNNDGSVSFITVFENPNKNSEQPSRSQETINFPAPYLPLDPLEDYSTGAYQNSQTVLGQQQQDKFGPNTWYTVQPARSYSDKLKNYIPREEIPDFLYLENEMIKLSKENVTIYLHKGYINITFTSGYLVIYLNKNFATPTTEKNPEISSPSTPKEEHTNPYEGNMVFELPKDKNTVTFTGGYLIATYPIKNVSRSIKSTGTTQPNKEITNQYENNMVFELPKEETVVTFTGGYIIANIIASSKPTSPTHKPNKESMLTFEFFNEDILINFLSEFHNRHNLTDKNEEYSQPLPHEETAIPFIGGYLISTVNKDKDSSKPDKTEDIIPNFLNNKEYDNFVFRLPKEKINLSLTGGYQLSSPSIQETDSSAKLASKDELNPFLETENIEISSNSNEPSTLGYLDGIMQPFATAENNKDVLSYDKKETEDPEILKLFG